MRKVFVLVLVVVLSLVFLPSCKKSSDSTDHVDPIPTEVGISVGKIATNFVEQDQDDAPFTLESLKGKVILLSFSALWCPPCRQEAPHLAELYNTYKEQGLEIVQVIHQDNDGAPADLTAVNSWVDTYSLPFTCTSDPDYSTVNTYSVSALPTNIVIDRDFAIRYRGEGFDPDSVKNTIEKYL